jgi:hypothetical protein
MGVCGKGWTGSMRDRLLCLMDPIPLHGCADRATE